MERPMWYIFIFSTSSDKLSWLAHGFLDNHDENSDDDDG